MESIVNRTVAEIVAEDYKTADVFKKYGIDFCCGGHTSVSEVCDKKKINLSDLERELSRISLMATASNNFNGWELDFLIDYIITVHHSYVTENIPRIKGYADKVAKVHGHHYKEVVEIKTLFDNVAEELMQHMHKEENILFPFIKELVIAHDEKKSLRNIPFGTIHNPIRMMELEHENAGATFKMIVRISNDYTPPPEGCNTYNVLYSKLREFEEDLHKHIHLENNILFPKAIRLSDNVMRITSMREH
ncbi:MAG: iron-sulfur cluster repair di-iron protein [Bacteroidetes bacterium]|nr:iron-sulfur cluster repair di-iron protein [Bacteroidota bacterium]MDA1121109.1 iron-sulfur cluster repair di-iron protein [Bacteroidota bacterium]